MYKNGFIRKIKLFLKSITSEPEKETIPIHIAQYLTK